MTINSYPSVFAIGHKAIRDIFSSPVEVTEKIDGSQCSIAIIDGELECRSKGQIIYPDAPEKMFTLAVETAKKLKDKLIPNWIYRCEFLSKTKHNTLKYGRVPKDHLIVFDIEFGNSEYLPHKEIKAEADRIGLECVPLLYKGKVNNIDFLDQLLYHESILGGTKVEGIVVKNYELFTLSEKKIMIGKYVSPEFKEAHQKTWKGEGKVDVLEKIISTYKTEARWQKSVQHLRDAGQLEESPRDIGNLIKEVQIDVRKECEDEIKELLFNSFWPQIQRGIIGGLPEWYKEQIAKLSFGE